MVLIFQHQLFHEGEAVITGKKYIMRRWVFEDFTLKSVLTFRIVFSDVMYKRVLSSPMSDKEREARDLIAAAEQYEDQSNFEEATKCYRKAYKLWPDLERE